MPAQDVTLDAHNWSLYLFSPLGITLFKTCSLVSDEYAVFVDKLIGNILPYAFVQVFGIHCKVFSIANSNK
jgi:hypothetical protein